MAAAEQRLGVNDDALSRAVAEYYYKLLAVKDEFEVARLWTDGSFQQQLEQQFNGDYRIALHLAPPKMPVIDRLLSREDPDTGKMRKIDFGPWFFTALKGMARLKAVRGTALDFFATEHRKLERSLAPAYVATVEELLAGLSKDNYEVAVQIAELPEFIRGYEHVKERTIEEVRDKERELLEAFRLRAPGGSAA